MNSKWFVIVAVTALVGCGGGSSSSNPNPVSLGSIPITADNADTAAAVAMDGVDSVTDASDGALDISGGAVGVRVEADTRVGSSQTAIELAIKARNQLTATVNNGGAVGVVITETIPCSVDGTVEFTIDTAGLSEEQFSAALAEGSIPAGTSVRMSFAGCIEPDENGNDETLNGAFEVTFLQFPLIGFIGESDFVIEIRSEFEDLTADGERVNGDMTVLMTSTSQGAIDIQMSGALLETTVNGRTTSLVDYVIAVGEDGDVVTTTYDFTVTDTQLGGDLTVETIDPFVSNPLDEWPMQGSLKISGADNTSVTVTALDTTFVQLEIDTDGDMMPNETIVLTWEELDALTPAQ